MKWDLRSGTQELISWSGSDGTDPPVILRKYPLLSTIAFTIAGGEMLLAVGSRNLPVVVLDIEQLQPVASFDVVANNGILAMAFNPTPRIPVLAVEYQHGHLCIFDYEKKGHVTTGRNIVASEICLVAKRTISSCSLPYRKYPTFHFRRSLWKENNSAVP